MSFPVILLTTIVASSSPSFDRESTTLLISESQPLPAELLAQASILLLQIFDHFLLVPVHPSGEEHHQKLERQRVHRLNLRPNRSRKLGRNRRSQQAARPWKTMVSPRPTFRTLRGNTRESRRRSSQKRPISVKFPVFSLPNRDLAPETSSLKTPPTAIESAVLQRLPARIQV